MGTSYVIPPGASRTIGRTSASDIVIADNFLSSRHFEVANVEGTAQLRDLQSLNKTRVNQEVVATTVLNLDDEVRAGTSRFRIAWEAVRSEAVRGKPNAAAPSSFSPPHLGSWSEGTGVGPLSGVGPRSSSSAGRSAEPRAERQDSPIESSFFDELPAVDARDQPVDRDSGKTGVPPKSGRPPNPASPPLDHDIGSPLDSFDVTSLSAEALPAAADNRPKGSSFAYKVESVSSEADLEPSDAISTPQLDSGESSSLSRYEDIGALDRLFLDSRHRPEPFLGLLVDLASSVNFCAIAHFRKLGREVPDGIPFVSLFPEFDPQGAFLPVAIGDRAWLEHCHGAFAKRLLANDGLLLAIGAGNAHESSQNLLRLQLQGLGKQGFEGFSEPNGFLAWCWPSMLKRMSGSLSDQALGRWMGEDLLGLVFPVDGVGRVEALVRPGISPKLQALGFQ